MTDKDAAAPSGLAPAEPSPAPQRSRYEDATPARRAEIDKAMAELDVADSNSILFFGSAAQDAVADVADDMLEGVRTRDAGAAGRALNEMVGTLRELPVTPPEPRNKPGRLGRLFRRPGPLGRMLRKYQQVRSQVDAISNRLDVHTNTLLKDIALLDRLYERTLEYFRRLEVYIAAGEERLRRLDADTLPALLREAAVGEVEKVQELAELRARRDELERRVHDLKLTRQITMQSLPAIRLVQQNDKALLGKIASTMANTIPLWRQQLAMSLAMARTAEAGETLERATDLTNELLTANAETLRTSTQAIRTQVERGVVDIAAVKRANDALIATIDDTLRIAEDARRQRADAEQQLAACEAEMKGALVSARRHGRPSGPDPRRDPAS